MTEEIRCFHEGTCLRSGFLGNSATESMFVIAEQQRSIIQEERKSPGASPQGIRLCLYGTVVELRTRESMSIDISSLHRNMALWHFSMRAYCSARVKGREPMGNQDIRMALDRHRAASAAGDSEAEHEIYHGDVLVEYPQSGERIRGRHTIQAVRSHHPAKLGFTIRRIQALG